MASQIKYRLSIVRDRATRGGNVATVGQVVTTLAPDPDTACEQIRARYAESRGAWYGGVQINWVKTAAEWDG